MSETFTCDDCGQTFAKVLSDEEVEAEAVANGFGDLPPEERAVVCDDCYQGIKARATAAGAWPKRLPSDQLASDIYAAVAQPDTIWWDDLTPDMQDAWRRGAQAAVRWLDDDMRARDERLRVDATPAAGLDARLALACLERFIDYSDSRHPQYVTANGIRQDMPRRFHADAVALRAALRVVVVPVAVPPPRPPADGEEDGDDAGQDRTSLLDTE